MEGPRLTDEVFFAEKIDTTRPGLAMIPALIAAGDYAGARRAFAADVRATLKPDTFPYDENRERSNTYTYDDETNEEAAERIMRLELISCGTPMQFEGTVDWFANPTYNQYKEWTWQLSRHWEWNLLGQLYRHSGDERYAEAVVKFFYSWIKQAVVPEPTPGNDTLCWRTIEAGIRMGQTWPRVLHSFIRSPHFTDDVIVDWYKSLWEHGWRLRNFYWLFNWRIMEMNGLGHIGILCPQFIDSAEWKAFAIERMVRELALQNFADGFQYELTTGYHQVNIRNYQYLWDVMAAHGEPIPQAFRDELEKMHSVNVQMMMPDGHLPDLNDGIAHAVDELMTSAVEHYPDRADFLWAYTQGREGTPPAEASIALPYSGYYVMRGGWEPDSFWLFFDGGHLGTNHQHEDKLSLLLHAYGRLLLTEGGNYAYDASAMRQYVLSTRSHNTIRIDGLDQNRKTPFFAQFRERMPTEDEIIALMNMPNRATWVSKGAYDLAESQYEEGYGPDVIRLVNHRRKVIFVKQPAAPLSPFALVIDRIDSTDGAPHACQSLWHMNTDTAHIDPANPLAVRSADDGGANLAILMAGDVEATLHVVKGQEEPEWQGWKSLGSGKQNNHVAIPTAIYEWTANPACRVVTLLYPTPAGVVAPVTHLTLAGTAIHLHCADGSVVAVDEADYV